MSASYGTLILDEADSGGNLIVRGSVTVALSQRVPDAGDDLIFGQAPVTGAFRAGGPPSVRLPFNDTFGPQGDDAPGTTYTITYNGVPGSPASWSFYLLSTNGATQRLSALASTPAAQPGQTYVPLPDTPPADDTYVLGLSSASPLVTEWVAGGGGGGGPGTVTSVAVETANGFAGTVANDTTDAQITLKANFTSGIVKAGSGGAISAATAGTDYLAPSGSGADLTGITATQVGADASGAAATAQGNAESFATSAVATETSRAETAEELLAPKASPTFTGTPAAPTASALTDSTQVATTAYADAAVAVETSRAETAEALKAPLASPALTGNPTAPTQSAGNDSTRLATTAYADAAVAVETSRAETAEALALPLTGGTMSGAIAMGSHKITGLTNGSASGDAAAFGQTPAGGNTVTIAEGGTGQTGQQAAMDALAGAVTSGDYLRGNGTHVAMSAIQAGDVPTLNQDTTGTAATATNLAGGATFPDYVAPKVVTLTDGSSVALDASTGNSFTWALGASSHTLAAPSNPVDGQAIKIRIKYGGSYTPEFDAVFDFGAAGAPSWTATSGKTDICGFEYDSSLNAGAGEWAYLGSVLGLTS